MTATAPLHGRHLLGGATSAERPPSFRAVDPDRGAPLPPDYAEASPAEVGRAARAAAEAFAALRALPPERIAGFLDGVAERIEALGDALLARAHAETALPLPRLASERERAVRQTRLFAALVREGSWVDARIDRGDLTRRPAPRPDLRRMAIPIGPVAVFGAANFPLAISAVGGDTLAALAAGCPVVAKAHPAHPGTSELLGEAVRAAASATGMPPGVFSLLHGRGHEVGLALVRHPEVRAVGFAGALRGGRALFDAAAARPEPIPVYAEMGSTNPIFLLPGALAERGGEIAAGWVESLSLGVGQFCTSPGLAFGVDGAALERFAAAVAARVAAVPPASMLHAGLRDAFEAGRARVAATPGVSLLGASSKAADPARTQAGAAVYALDLASFEEHPHLAEEVFGPVALLVRCADAAELERAARGLAGQLSAALHANEGDLAAHAALLALLETRVGRLIANGFPTGIEVCAAMHHGGPWPATTDPHFGSIGTAAIQRFARPLCYQNVPDPALPPALRDANPLRIWRLVDGEWSR